MRIYNRWYEELWFWIQENKEETIQIVLGVVLAGAVVYSYIYFMKGTI